MTINLSTSLTIAPGETFAFANGPVFYMEQYPDDFWFRNYGTIHATGTNAIGFLGWNSRGNFLNEGLIRVDAANQQSYCLDFESWGPNVVNKGRIEMNGPGTAVRSWSPGQHFDNQGVIIATGTNGSGTAAMWFKNGVQLINSGQILAYGGSACAIEIDDFHRSDEIAPTVYRHDGYFENRGDVIAVSSGGGTSHGLLLSGEQPAYVPTAPNIVNYGLIQADRAIWWTQGSYDPQAEQWVVNHGRILGDVFLDSGNDLFISDGEFTGFLDMAEGDDFVNLTGSVGTARVDMGSGDDIARGSAFADQIDGFSGDDQLFGEGGNDILYSSEGDDVMSGGSGNDSLKGGWDRDILSGGDGDDVIWGDEVYQMLYFVGEDRLDGGAGDDLLIGGQHNDWLDGGEGLDTAGFLGMRSNYSLETTGGVSTITGADGRDTLRGIERLQFFDGLYTIEGHLISRPQDESPGNDTLTGNQDANEIRGGGGDDVITPGWGRDLVDGGEGNDVVWFEGKRSDYKIVAVGDDFLVASSYSDTDYLCRVETIRFRGGGTIELNRMYERGDESGPQVLPSLQNEGGLEKDFGPEPQVSPVISDIVRGLPHPMALMDEHIRPLHEPGWFCLV